MNINEMFSSFTKLEKPTSKVEVDNFKSSKSEEVIVTKDPHNICAIAVRKYNLAYTESTQSFRIGPLPKKEAYNIYDALHGMGIGYFAQADGPLVANLDSQPIFICFTAKQAHQFRSFLEDNEITYSSV